MTAEMGEELESIQKRACKLIFGWDVKYRELVEGGKIEPLSERRKRLILNFAKKTEKNPRASSHGFQRKTMKI